MKTAVILVAGMGTRLNDITKGEFPKPFLQINEKPLIERSIENLNFFGVERIILVTGHLKEFFEILSEKYDGIEIIENSDYSNTSSMGSFYVTKDLIKDEDEILLLEGDLIYERKAIEILINSKKKDAILLTEDKQMSDDYYFEINNDSIGKLTSNLNEISGEYGEMTGLQKLSNSLFMKMFETYEKLNNSKLAYEGCLTEIAKTRKISYEKGNGILWSEIDDEYQLKRVMKEIYPKLVEKGEY